MDGDELLLEEQFNNSGAVKSICVVRTELFSDLMQEADKLSESGQYVPATVKMQEALDVAIQSGDKRFKIFVLRKLSVAFRDLGDFATAIGFYHQCMQYWANEGNLVGQAEACDNIGYCYLRMGELSDHELFTQKAEELRQHSLIIPSTVESSEDALARADAYFQSRADARAAAAGGATAAPRRRQRRSSVIALRRDSEASEPDAAADARGAESARLNAAVAALRRPGAERSEEELDMLFDILSAVPFLAQHADAIQRRALCAAVTYESHQENFILFDKGDHADKVHAPPDCSKSSQRTSPKVSEQLTATADSEQDRPLAHSEHSHKALTPTFLCSGDSVRWRCRLNFRASSHRLTPDTAQPLHRAVSDHPAFSGPNLPDARAGVGAARLHSLSRRLRRVCRPRR